MTPYFRIKRQTHRSYKKLHIQVFTFRYCGAIMSSCFIIFSFTAIQYLAHKVSLKPLLSLFCERRSNRLISDKKVHGTGILKLNIRVVPYMNRLVNTNLKFIQNHLFNLNLSKDLKHSTQCLLLQMSCNHCVFYILYGRNSRVFKNVNAKSYSSWSVICINSEDLLTTQPSEPINS